MKVSTPHFKFKRVVLVIGLVFGMAACNTDDLAPPPPPPAVNNAPNIVSTAPTTANEGQPYSYNFTATDPDADPLSYSASAPAWLTLDTATGLLTGAPGSTDVGDNVVTLTVSDGTDSVTQTFTIVVIAALPNNVPPTFTSTPNLNGAVDAEYSYTATAEDLNFDDISFSSVTLPAWATFNADTGVLVGTPDIPGDYPVELMISDGAEDVSQNFTVLVTGPAVVTVELSVFENAALPEWALWTDNGGPFEVVTVEGDPDRDQAAKFTLTKASVAGFTARESGGAIGGMPFDASGFVSTGQVSFELLLLAETDVPVSNWFFKVEAGSGNSAKEVTLSSSLEGHSAPELNVWQTYTFPLETLANGGTLDPAGIDLFMVFPSYGDAAGASYLIDNFKLVSVVGGVEPPPTPANTIDFEDAAETYVWGDFGGGIVTILPNPDASGINTSAQVGRMQKFAEEVFGGSTFTLPNPIDLIDGDIFKLKVWSTRSVPVLFKLEGLNVERTAQHTGSGWEELAFDFTGDSGAGVAKITLIFENGTNGDAENAPDSWTFYFDDMALPEGDPVEVEPLPVVADGTVVDFEAAPDSYTFGDFGGGAVSVIDNPDTSGINPSVQVARMQKLAGEVFGGTTFTLPGTYDVASGDVFTMKVWSSRVVPLTFKLEQLNVERVVNHGGTGWEELTFDFTGDSGNGLTSLTLIFDNGTNGDAENTPDDWTFYFDDITYPEDEPLPEIALGTVVDFEAAADSYTFGDFGGGATAVIDNPDTNGNASSQVGRMQKFAGDLFGGTTFTLPGTFNVTSGDVFTMKVWSSRVVPLTFKLEQLNVERVVNHGGTGWEELTFDFAGDSGDGLTSLTLIFENGTNGDAENTPDDWTFYFDDITFPAAQ